MINENNVVYLWCLHCERTYKDGEFREVVEKVPYGQTETYEMCPYDDCDGDTVIDAKTWKWVKSINPQYPSVPLSNVVYSLYPAERHS